MKPAVPFRLDGDAEPGCQRRGAEHAERLAEHQPGHDRKHEHAAPVEDARSQGDAGIGKGEKRKHQVARPGAGMPQLALFLKQMREQGLKAQFIGPDIGFTVDFITQVGAASAEGALMTFQLPPYDSSPELKDFTQRHQARFGRAPGPYASLGFANAQVMAAAVEKAASLDREGVLAQLHDVKIETLLGPVAFDENGENTTAPMYLYVVKNGKFELIKQ